MTVAASKQEHAQQWLNAALDRFEVKVACTGCGQTVGRYRPGRVALPSLSRPAVNFRCMRAGCHTETVHILGEHIE